MNRTLLALALVAGCGTARPPVAPTTATVELAAQRARMIGWLTAYEQAGVFPVDATGQPISVFVDTHGTRCPMAELIHDSGRDDLVGAIAREDNTARLADVHTGPLHDWMLASGLTLDEIAMIQGAMNIDEMMLARQYARIEVRQAAAKAEVKGRLETAETALRNNTPAGLASATTQLHGARPAKLAASPIRGRILAKPVAVARP